MYIDAATATAMASAEAGLRAPVQSRRGDALFEDGVAPRLHGAGERAVVHAAAGGGRVGLDRWGRACSNYCWVEP